MTETGDLLFAITRAHPGSPADWPHEEVLILRALAACLDAQRRGVGDRLFREQLNQMIGSFKFELRDRGHDEI